MRIGLVNVNDSLLLKNKRVPEKHSKKFLGQAAKIMVANGFDVFEIELTQLLERNLKRDSLYLQFTITEEIEESKSGKELLYRVPVSTLQVWVQDDALSHRHVEKIALHVYEAYSEKLLSGMMDDLAALVCKRLNAMDSK